MGDGSLEARVVGGVQRGTVGQVLGVVGIAGQEIEGMPLVDSRIEAGG